MPVVHRARGFAFRIYPGDHAPPHVHAVNAEGEARIAIGDDETPPAILSVYGLGDRDVIRAYRIVERHQHKLLSAWRSINGA